MELYGCRRVSTYIHGRSRYGVLYVDAPGKTDRGEVKKHLETAKTGRLKVYAFSADGGRCRGYLP